MKKILKRLTKLINFLIRTLNRAAKIGLQICDEYQRSGDKVVKIIQVVAELEKVVEVLDEKRKQIEQLSED